MKYITEFGGEEADKTGAQSAAGSSRPVSSPPRRDRHLVQKDRGERRERRGNRQSPYSRSYARRHSRSRSR